MQQDVDRAARQSNIPPPGMRIGCNVGEVISEAGADGAEDVFGAAVVLRRTCAHAKAGQILVTDLVRLLIGSRSDVDFVAVGPVTLKGFAEPVTLHEVPWVPVVDDPPCRIVVADDATLIRSGIVRLLADEGFDVAGEAGDAEELLALVDRVRPDLVITDIRMPPTQTDEGLRAAATIRAEHPDVAVLVLSQHVEARGAAGLLDDHAAGVGYLLKERVGQLDEFVAACRAVAAGGRVVDPMVAEQLVQSGAPRGSGRAADRHERGAVVDGAGPLQRLIASALAMSPKTVETHVRAIFTKLDLAENATTIAASPPSSSGCSRPRWPRRRVSPGGSRTASRARRRYRLAGARRRRRRRSSGR